jgi:hypothetical protein
MTLIATFKAKPQDVQRFARNSFLGEYCPEVPT